MAVVHSSELLDIIIDGGESAKSLNRPGMARLLALVDAGEVQAAAVCSSSFLNSVPQYWRPPSWGSARHACRPSHSRSNCFA